MSLSSKDALWVEGPPLLAVEVVELDENYEVVDRLIAASLAAGVKAVWVIDPFEEFVAVHRASRRPLLIRGTSELAPGAVLPGFRCRVAEIFE